MHLILRYTAILYFIASCSEIIGQNTAPQLTLLSVNPDTANRTITILYDVQDNENDTLEISVFLSADSGTTYLVPGTSVSGEVGFPVMPGSNKSAVLSYNFDSLTAVAQDVSAWSNIKIVATDRKSPELVDIISQIDSGEVLNDMQLLAHPRHHVNAPEGLVAVKNAIENEFHNSNLQTTRLPFNFGTVASENIKGRRPGLLRESEVVIIDGHFDAVANTSGADDNASAIAAVLATLRAFENYHFERSINFLAFDKEEQGLQGAANYIVNNIEPHEDIIAVLNGEMIGYYDTTANSQNVPAGFNLAFPAVVDSIQNEDNRGIFIFVVGNTQNSAWLSAVFDSVARANVPGVRSIVLDAPGLGQLTPDLRRSDHAVFWDAGISALMITDGADTRNPHYHQISDTIGTLNLPYLVRNIKAMAATLAYLAKPIYADVATSNPFQLLVSHPTGTPQLDPFQSIDVFPNPSGGEINLKFPIPVDNAQIVVIDPIGREVLRETVRAGAGETVPLPILSHNHTGIASGMYSVEINIESKRYTRKLLIYEGHQH